MHPINQRRLRAGALVCLGAVSGAAAAAPAATTLPPLVVTASRTPEPAGEALASVTVITREEIERRQPHDVLDLLRGVVSVDVARQGGPGKLSSLFLRGAAPGQTLVLVNGIRLSAVTDGRASLEFLPVEQIERIEIVRGPRSTLYGADAIGGVIQIFTRDGGQGDDASASLEAGSRGSGRLTVGSTLDWGDTRLHVDGSVSRTGGFNARAPSVNPFTGTIVSEPDDDGYRNRALNVALTQDLDRFGHAELNALHYAGRAEFDPSFANGGPNVVEFDNQVLQGRYRIDLGDRATLSLRAGQTTDSRHTYRDDVADSGTRFETTRRSIALETTVNVGVDSRVVAGAELFQDHLDSTTDYERDSRTTRAVFASYATTVADQDLQAGLRHTDDGQFGGHDTYSLAWGTDLGRDYRVRAAYGTAFRAPTFNDLYYPLFGNPELDPEESRSLELGLSGDHAWGWWDASAYRTRISDLIVFQGLRPENVSSARLSGIELRVGTELGPWNVELAADYLRPENLDTGEDLIRRPRRSLSVDLWREWDRFSLGATVLTGSERYDQVSGERVRLGGFTVVDVYAAFELSPAWTLRARIDNLFDKDYRTVEFYNTGGRAAYLTLAWQLPD